MKNILKRGGNDSKDSNEKPQASSEDVKLEPKLVWSGTEEEYKAIMDAQNIAIRDRAREVRAAAGDTSTPAEYVGSGQLPGRTASHVINIAIRDRAREARAAAGDTSTPAEYVGSTSMGEHQET